LRPLKGGLGSASVVLEGFTAGALVAGQHRFGSAVDPATAHYGRSPAAARSEFGGDEARRRPADEPWHRVFGPAARR